MSAVEDFKEVERASVSPAMLAWLPEGDAPPMFGLDRSQPMRAFDRVPKATRWERVMWWLRRLA